MTDRWTDAGRMDGGKKNVLVHPYHEGKFVYVEVLHHINPMWSYRVWSVYLTTL